MGERRRIGRTTAAAVLAVAGGLVLWAAVQAGEVSGPPRAEGQPSGPVLTDDPSEGTAGRDKSGIEDEISGTVLPESDPVRVALPRLGVSSSLLPLGVDAAGAMEVPADPALAGWYTLGPSPGALGPAVIAGHVTWDRQPAVFFELGRLRPDDRVVVSREDGRDAVFSVTKVVSFPKSRFPTRAVFGPLAHAGLRLITCGGTYDAASRRYLDNVVVFARLVDVRRGSG